MFPTIPTLIEYEPIKEKKRKKNKKKKEKNKEKKEIKKSKGEFFLKFSIIRINDCDTFHIARDFRRCEKPSGLHIPWL